MTVLDKELHSLSKAKVTLIKLKAPRHQKVKSFHLINKLLKIRQKMGQKNMIKILKNYKWEHMVFRHLHLQSKLEQ
jgi:hypothetical protein